MIREAARSLVREPVGSGAAAACAAVGVAVAASLLSLVGVGPRWPPALAPDVHPSALVGPLGAPSLGWSSGATMVDVLRRADLRALVGLLAVVGVVGLLAAAVAVWVLVAARTRRRGRELRIRAAVGARCSDLRRQLRLEAGLLAVAGGAAGAVLGTAAAVWLRAVGGGRGLVWGGGGSTALAVLVSVVILLATAVAAPGAAWGRRWRRRSAASGDPSPAPFQDLLVVGAVAALVVVVVGAGLLVRSYRPRIDAASGGAGISNVAILRLQAPGGGEVGRRDAERALGVAARHPDTVGQALSSGAAWAGQGPLDRVVAQCLCWRGGAFLPVVTSRIAHAAVGAGFFDALGVDLVEGRELRREDRERGRRVAVVDRRFLRLTGGTSPVGKWIRVAGAELSAGPAEDRYRIVGVVEEGRYAGLGARGSGPPLVYVPAYLHPAGHPDLVVRVRGDAASTGRELAETLRAQVPALRVEAKTLEERTAELAGPLVWASRGLGGASAGILLLAVFAVGGLAADETRRQRAEMALRRAVGARRRQVVGRVLKRALGLAVRAAVVGVVGAGGLAATLNELLHGLEIRDPLPWISTLAVVVGAAVIGSLGPALRAARQDPVRWLGVRES